MNYIALLLSFSLLFSVTTFTGQTLAGEANKRSQTISPAGSQSSVKGPAEYFSGNVRIDPLFPANDSAPYSGAYVTFEPGAKSAWRADSSDRTAPNVTSALAGHRSGEAR